jgi:hypothetical protein
MSIHESPLEDSTIATKAYYALLHHWRRVRSIALRSCYNYAPVGTSGPFMQQPQGLHLGSRMQRTLKCYPTMQFWLLPIYIRARLLQGVPLVSLSWRLVWGIGATN